MKLKLPVIIFLLIILAESVMAQIRSVVFCVNEPSPVCFPSRVDLTTAAITKGSTEGLIFSYFLDSMFTVPVPNPTQVTDGKYFIKGELDNVYGGFFVSGSVKITIYEKPKLIITDPRLENLNDKADLTLPQNTVGSDNGLIFTYWYDNEAKKPLLFPKTTEIGNYFVKGTSTHGCYDIQLITVKN